MIVCFYERRLILSAVVFCFLFLSQTPKGHAKAAFGNVALYGDVVLEKNNGVKTMRAKTGFYQFSTSDSHLIRFVDIGITNSWPQSRVAFLGGGARRLLGNDGWGGGVNTYFSSIDNEAKWKQISWGFEWFSPFFLLSGNLYLPLGGRQVGNKEVVFDDYIGPYWVFCRETKIAPLSWDLLLWGNPCLMSGRAVGWASGFYVLDYEGHSVVVGVQGSVFFYAFKGFYIEAQADYDQASGGIFGLRMAFYGLQYGPSGGRMNGLHPVSRRFHIPTKKICIYETNY